eukprot:TRINITY_DN6073_c0_g1_i2.p1 TRINITY_DN6073_c0_g1~~TRINITY_DN6073_c0_g1_i2.p1  ORF type:complete len:734 (-),score=88.08 TRINITY_DN6073_c0_g1_i2:422-2623(-)
MLDEHQRIGKEIQTTAENRFKHASAEINEIQVQDACVRYAITYFKQYYDRHISKYKESLVSCHKQLQMHEELRMRIDQDIEFMQKQQLHPDLLNRQTKWKNLIDVIGYTNITQTVDAYKNIQLQVKKVSHQGDDDVEALQHMVDQATDTGSNLESIGLDLELIHQEAEQKNLDLAQMQNYITQLGKDRNEMLEKCMSAIGQPQKLTQQLKVFQQLTVQHETILNHLNVRDTQMEDFRRFCRDQKCEALKQLIHVFTHIQSVQNKNRSIEKKMVSLTELLRREEQCYLSVLRIHEFPFIYMQSLADCVRRKIWNSRYQEVAHLGQQKLETIRETQNKVQQSFNQKVEQVIGHELLGLMGLNNPPPDHVLQLLNSDDFVKELVQVDANYLREIQRHLPAYLQPKLQNYLSSSTYRSMGVPSSSSKQTDSEQESVKSLKNKIQGLEMEKLWLSQRVIEEIVGRFELMMKLGDQSNSQHLSRDQQSAMVQQIQSMQKTIEQVNQDQLKNRVIEQLEERVQQLENTNHSQDVELQSLRAIATVSTVEEENKQLWEAAQLGGHAPSSDPQRQPHSSSLGSSHGFLGISDSLRWSYKELSSSPPSKTTLKSFSEGYTYPQQRQVQDWDQGQGQGQIQSLGKEQGGNPISSITLQPQQDQTQESNEICQEEQIGQKIPEEVFQVVEKPSETEPASPENEGQKLVGGSEEMSHTSQLTLELKAGKQCEIMQQSFHSAESGSD